ncbi:MAG: tRNA (guanosine(37)-N1)-methyltransferase TrmD [Rickettsiales bacterium]|jgi:tRNA (guanine37-N1)-methyltransferase|nr:tRNA (guanosine(37)-N1)-methyltransferase TrmD [Rickettsiales bacterium]
MHFDIITLFPEMFPGTLGGGVVGRALENKIWSFDAINPRGFTDGNYRRVDDTQFGGGAGQVMMAEPIARTIDEIKKNRHAGLDPASMDSGSRADAPVRNDERKIIYFSPRGRVWNQKLAREYAGKDYTLICGRYEGLDQRVIDEYEIEEISIGDYILSGGEIAAQVFIDSLVRLCDNVLHSAESAQSESFEIGGLEWPLYTRPSSWRGRNVPEVLMSGNHAAIERWRKEQSDAITNQRRPDLIKKVES